jgi:hypothetical protein
MCIETKIFYTIRSKYHFNNKITRYARKSRLKLFGTIDLDKANKRFR